jgi:hypothetical protein
MPKLPFQKPEVAFQMPKQLPVYPIILNMKHLYIKIAFHFKIALLILTLQ